jgi:4,5-dihydroxyphthalate decarboxylase
MKKIPLTIAASEYEHFRDFREGLVEAAGIEPLWLTLDLHEIFSRFAAVREWHVSEMSFAKFSAQATAPNADIIGLPVFASRVFRLSSFYVNRKAGIRTPQDLKGKSVGLPEWAQTAAVYSRGWLQHEAGVPLTSIQWVQAGIETAGRTEKVDLALPEGLKLRREPTRTLNEMLVSGEVDAVMTASAPSAFERGHPDVARLMPDYREKEADYYRRTRIYPIMHVMAMRKDVLAEHPWIARNLCLAFEESKNRSLERLKEAGATRYPVPWLAHYIETLTEDFGPDIFPFGIEANRPTLEAFLRYSHEQGIAKRRAKPEDIFPPGIEPSTAV